MKVMEEISDVVQVCQNMPRVLDYYIWIIDKMYADGFMGFESERDKDYNFFDDNDQSMQLSAISESKKVSFTLLMLCRYSSYSTASLTLLNISPNDLGNSIIEW